MSSVNTLRHHIFSFIKPLRMDQKRIKLVALDLDGTTLDNNHKFTVKTIETLQRLNNAGVIIVLATGRSTLDIVKHFRQLELAQKVCPGVGYNGAHGFVCSFDGEEHINSSVFECPLNKEQCIDLVKFAKEKGHVLQVRCINDLLMICY